LSDWDKFMPIGYENDKGADLYFESRKDTGKSPCTKPLGGCGHCNHIRQANPYAREPVILDEYTKNRDVWRCPSAIYINTPGYIVPSGRNNWWVNSYIDHPNWYHDWMAPPCTTGWPTGWGGTVTDSFVQGPLPNDGKTVGAFSSGIGVYDDLHWTTPAQINDPARYPTVTDNGQSPYPWNLKTIAWPDHSLCGLCMCNGKLADSTCCDGDGSASCPGLTHAQKLQFVKDASFRNSMTRHMGGSNMGFVDGHARWVASEALLSGVPPNNTSGEPLVEDLSGW